MKILICAAKDLLGCLALNQLFAGLVEDELAVLLSTKRRSSAAGPQEIEFLEVIESTFLNDLYFPSVEMLALPPGGRNLTFAELASNRRAPLIEVGSLKDDEAINFVAGFRPELIVSARFSYIFDRKMISSTPLGIINVHPGALPRYAGLFPVFWQMLEGCPELGCSVHFVDSGIDTGGLICVERLACDRAKSMISHNAELYRLGIAAAVRAIDRLRNGLNVDRHDQNRAQRAYFGLPTPTEFATFRSLGLKLFTPQDLVCLMGSHLQRGEQPALT